MAGLFIGTRWKAVDIYYGGNKKITGTVTQIEGSRRVILHDRKSALPIRTIWSSNGTYEFKYVADKEYYVVAIDHENQWNPAAVDLPVLVPV